MSSAARPSRSERRFGRRLPSPRMHAGVLALRDEFALAACDLAVRLLDLRCQHRRVFGLFRRLCLRPFDERHPIVVDLASGGQRSVQCGQVEVETRQRLACRDLALLQRVPFVTQRLDAFTRAQKLRSGLVEGSRRPRRCGQLFFDGGTARVASGMVGGKIPQRFLQPFDPPECVIESFDLGLCRSRRVPNVASDASWPLAATTPCSAARARADARRRSTSTSMRSASVESAAARDACSLAWMPAHATSSTQSARTSSVIAGGLSDDRSAMACRNAVRALASRARSFFSLVRSCVICASNAVRASLGHCHRLGGLGHRRQLCRDGLDRD